MPKKKTYIKKTDKNKPWLKKTKPANYKIETIEPKKTILIVCEGQTEELYFKSFPVVTLNIKAIGLGQSKLQLVEVLKKFNKIKIMTRFGVYST